MDALDLFCSPHIPITKLFVDAGLCESTSEARRLIEQGGLYIGYHPDDMWRIQSHRAGLTRVDDGVLYVEIRE